MQATNTVCMFTMKTSRSLTNKIVPRLFWIQGRNVASLGFHCYHAFKVTSLILKHVSKQYLPYVCSGFAFVDNLARPLTSLTYCIFVNLSGNYTMGSKTSAFPWRILWASAGSVIAFLVLVAVVFFLLRFWFKKGNNTTCAGVSCTDCLLFILLL